MLGFILPTGWTSIHTGLKQQSRNNNAEVVVSPSSAASCSTTAPTGVRHNRSCSTCYSSQATMHLLPSGTPRGVRKHRELTASHSCPRRGKRRPRLRSNGSDYHHENESASRSRAEGAHDEIADEDVDNVQVDHVPMLLGREGSAKRLDKLDDVECTTENRPSLRNRPEDLLRLKEMGKKLKWRQALDVFRRAKKDGTLVMDNGIYR